MAYLAVAAFAVLPKHINTDPYPADVASCLQAEWAIEQVQQHGGLVRSLVELQQADIMSCNLEGGTHFFVCSTAFSGSACRLLAERLARLDSFQVLVTSRALPFQPHLQVRNFVPCMCTAPT